MATKAKPLFAVRGVDSLPPGSPYIFYEKGIGAHESTRVNAEVTLQLDNGTEVTAKVQHLQVATLIELLSMNGMQAPGMMNRPSPLSTIQTLTDAATENVLDVTKLYTAVTVMVPYVMPTGALPAA